MSTIHIQRLVPAKGIPSAASLRGWAEAARGKRRGEITLRIVDADEGLSLNQSWRGKAYATNVLSFPMQEKDYLGDIVICADNQALEFVVDNRAALFAGVPIVFCSVDDWSPLLMVALCDHPSAAVQQFGRDMISTHCDIADES